MLDTARKKGAEYLIESEFSSNPVIKVWRDAFQKFKTKKGARSSIEALLKRVEKANSLNCINPLVDIYNSISLTYALPCGGEDIEKMQGDIRLTLADGDEEFVALGSDENSPPYQGEVIYKDNAGAICRCWNWREAVRTMLTENTTQAFLCLELIDDTRSREFLDSLDDLKGRIEKNLGGSCRTHILSMDNKVVTYKESE